MCGLAGVVSLKKGFDYNDRALIERILAGQHFRGPDHKHLVHYESKDCDIVFGHNRLGIIDLDPCSNQPMWDERKRYCLVYNGMLYNYVELRTRLQDLGHHFFSQGDTEVVLKAFSEWGITSLRYFNGMFALAIFDTVTQCLYLAKDRVGKKPLYYYQTEDKIYFASTSTILADHFKLQPNLAELANGLNQWCYGLNNQTVYMSLQTVAPSEIIRIEFNDNLKMVRTNYYDFAHEVLRRKNDLKLLSNQQMIDEVATILDDAIAIRLRSDVAMGVTLSGGLDSALITSLAKQRSVDFSCFSYGLLGDPYTEAALANKSADFIGVNINFVYPDAAKMQDDFWATLAFQDAPFPNFSIVAQHLVFKMAHDQGIKVMLGGQGSDEIFMGYRKYLLFYLKKLFINRQFTRGSVFLSQLLPVLLSELNKLPAYYKNLSRYTKHNHREGRWSYEPSSLGMDAQQLLWQRQLSDISHFSLPSLLRYEDSNSMAHSIESRLPFLDYRLMELALALPDELKIKNGYGKWVLREIAKGLVPREISHSRIKRGFDTQTKRWLAGGVGQSIRSRLKDCPQLLGHLKLTNQVDTVFADELLLKQPNLLAESITLAWLATKPHFVW